MPPLFGGLVELGRVTAGIPLEAIEDRQRNELLSLLTAPGRYGLQVSDDSMCDAEAICVFMMHMPDVISPARKPYGHRKTV